MSSSAEQLKAAFAHAQQGRLTEAARICRALLETDPARLEAHYLLGLEASARGEHEAASAHLERYLSRRRSDAGGWFNLGVVRQHAGDGAGAVAAYRRVLELAPGMAEARVNLAVALEQGGDGRDALATLEQGIEQGAPPLVMAHWLRLSRSMRGLDATCTRIGDIVKRFPERAELRAEYAALLAEAGRSDQARDELATARASLPDPADETTVLALARAQITAGSPRPVVRLLERALARSESAALRDALAVVLAAAGDADAAITESRRAVALAPRNASYWFNLAANLSRRTDESDLEAASAAAERALALKPGHAAASHCLGLVAAKLGRRGQAEAALQSAHRLAPEVLRYAIDLGDFHVRGGSLDRGVAVLSAIDESTDHAGEGARQLGVALLRAGRFAAALEALDRAEGRACVDQRVIAHRATALQHLGRHAEAEDYLGFDRHIRQVRFRPPEGFSDLAGFNAALADDIRGHSRLRWEPVGLAARNGSLTEELLADRTPAILAFESQLRGAIEAVRTGVTHDPGDPFLRRVPGPDYDLNIWATCVRGGGHIDTHIHEESWLSGAYYVHLPGSIGASAESPAGWIEFGRPHSEIPFPDGSRLELVRPEAGLLVLFPSFLFHRTLPHEGDEDRISISFDLVPA